MKCALLIFILFFAVLPTPRAAELKPAAAYAAEPVYHSVSLSPNGRFLAVAQDAKSAESMEKIKELNDRMSLSNRQARELVAAILPNHDVMVFDLTGEMRPQKIEVAGNLVQNVSWANNDRVLITVGVPITRGYWSFAGTVILSVDINNGELTSLLDNNRSAGRNNTNLANVVHRLPAEPNFVLMGAYYGDEYALWRVNVENGDGERIEQGRKGTFRWITDRNGRAVVRLDRDKHGYEMTVHALVGGSWRKIAQAPLRKDTDDPPNFWPIGPGEKTNEIYMLSQQGDEDKATIKVFDLDTGKFAETVLAHPDYDMLGGLIDRATGAYAGGYYYGNRYHQVLADPSAQKHIEALVSFFGDDVNVSILDYSSSRTNFLVRITGPQNPGQYYVYDVESASIDPLFSNFPRLTAVDLSPTESFTYVAKDGEKLSGYLTHPNGISDGVVPLIVMPHGGPEARDIYGFDAFAQFLASRGYRVFQPNFRGSSGFGRRFAEAGYGEWGGLIQSDIEDGVRTLIDIGLADAKNMCIVGASFGGYSALYGAVNKAELYACAVSIAGVSDLRKMMEYDLDRFGAGSGTFLYLRKSIGDPRVNKVRMERHSPARHAEKISIPVLLIHGDTDWVVPIEQSEYMMEAMDDAGRAYESLIIEGEGHSFIRETSRILYFRKVEEFLRQHLPTGKSN